MRDFSASYLERKIENYRWDSTQHDAAFIVVVGREKKELELSLFFGGKGAWRAHATWRVSRG